MKTREFSTAPTGMFAAVMVLCMIAILASTATACTGIRLVARDGSIIYARTLEFGEGMESNMLIVPRSRAFVGETALNTPGLRWNTKYGFVGPNAHGMPYVCDGLNEKGLAVGNFLFPGTAGYQKIDKTNADRAITSIQVAVYLLGTCATVDEAVNALHGVRVGTVDMGPLNALLDLHFAVNDAQGHCAVIEYVDGKMYVYDNPLGVITNSPTFDWHQTNLRNYIHLSPNNAAPVVMSGEKLVASRFVRAVAFTQAAPPTDSAQECVWQAFHLLNQFDLPLGAIRGSDNGKQIADFTNWTTAADMKHLRYYFNTYLNRRLKMIDLNKIDFSAKDLQIISMQEPESAQDVSDSAKHWTPKD
ncbi:MAG: linear amide C-N hydrolase [Thermoguttaceae bacterium]